MNLESPDSGRRPAVEPVLPLINVVFLLLIFFMVAGQLAPRPDSDVETPESATADTEEDREQLMLVLDGDGQLRYQGETLEQSRVESLIQEHLERRQQRQASDADTGAPGDDNNQPPVRLLADAGASLSTLRGSLETLRDAGVEEVRLVTKSESAP